MRACAIAIVAASLLPIAQFPANAQFPADPLFFIGEAREVLTGSGRFGTSVAGAGDVNDDGFADVIIGAPEFLVGGNPQGAAFVFHGRTYGIPNGSNTNPDAQLTSGQTGPAVSPLRWAGWCRPPPTWTQISVRPWRVWVTSTAMASTTSSSAVPTFQTAATSVGSSSIARGKTLRGSSRLPRSAPSLSRRSRH